MPEFSISAVKNILKSQGDKRVSKDAAKSLRQVLEMFAGDIAEQAIVVAEEKERKTIRPEDITQSLK